MVLKSISRRQLFTLWYVVLSLFIVLLVQPISYGIMRLTTLLLGLLLWGGVLFLYWHKKPIRYLSLSLAIALSLFLILPGHPGDKKRLQNAYIRELQSYDGTSYVWGGENHLGIDCSGLVRQGLVQANWKLGLKTLNPALVRKGIELWWYDAGADALRDEYRNFTKRRQQATSINDLNHHTIQPGDLAVTVDGEHILAYLGNSIWIEADPGYLKVIQVTVPEPDNLWFNVPIYVLRWQQLSSPVQASPSSPQIANLNDTKPEQKEGMKDL
jgi:hypothetical protein